jgi:N,N'-diacetylchitobiose transport system permease protein
MVTSSHNRPGSPSSPAGSTLSPEPGGARNAAGRSAPPSPASLGLPFRRRAGIWIKKRGAAPYLLLLPATAVIAALILYPAVQIGLFSFQDYGLMQISGVLPAQWVGWANYSQILHDHEFWVSLKISLYFAVIVVPLTLIVGTLVGLLLERLGPKMRTFVSLSAILAWATPAVSASVIFAWLVSPDGGVVDWALAKLPSWLGGGAHWAGFSWTNAPLPAYTVLTVMLVWTGFPFIAVTVLAGLRTLPSELHEAARVDGAGPWRDFWQVTFPLLRPVFLVLALLSTIWDFGMFTQAYIINGQLGNPDQYNLGLYEYAQAFTQPPHYGLASAAAFVLTIILLIVTVGYVRAAVKQGALA